ncbi:MAG TPA: methyltransferase domain-containing protein [Candidatus Binatia bacterium]|nr:methyltransferase domain-containing protein [Candidatus Binatia bacterium]
MDLHRDRILDQFTRQALPFSTAPGIRDEAALQLLVETSGAGPDDSVLDVACGPGLVVTAFARVVRHATGIDVTPAMLERAREVAAGAGLRNVSFLEGDVTHLPWPDGSFSVAVSRFAFHHFQDPAAVLGEMRRVCRPGGRIVVCDLLASDDPVKAAAFHRIEVLRDPSHVRALTLAELTGLCSGAGLPGPRAAFYRLEFELEGLLERSFPRAEDVATIRAAYVASAEDDGLGLGTRRVRDQIRAAYPVAILAADRP